jgi:hypothetical protein
MVQNNEDLPSVVAAPVAATEAGIVVEIPPITGSAVVLCGAIAPTFPLKPSVQPF